MYRTEYTFIRVDQFQVKQVVVHLELLLQPISFSRRVILPECRHPLVEVWARDSGVGNLQCLQHGCVNE